MATVRIGGVLAVDSGAAWSGGAVRRAAGGADLPGTGPPVPDLLVLGGTFGGCAVALEAAHAGRTVVLVEPRTYLGYETSALLRPWVPAAALAAPPALLRPWIAEAAPLPAAGAEVPLYPDAVKLGLEDTLLAAGVRLLYASQPVGAVFQGDRLAGAVVGNKSGRQAILARGVVDATDWAIFARLAGAPFRQQALPGPVEVRRTLEFTGVGALGDGNATPAMLALPAQLGLVGDAAHLHRGYLGASHALIECRFVLPLASADLPGRMALEVAARHRTMEVAARLVADHPAFAGAYLAHASWEVWLRSPWRLAAGNGRAGADRTDGGGAVPGVPNLFVTGTAAGGGSPGAGEEAALLLEPLAAARAGEALAPRLLAALEDTAQPDAARCVARCAALSVAPDAPLESDAPLAPLAPDASEALDARRATTPAGRRAPIEQRASIEPRAPIELREPFGAQRGRTYARVTEPPADVPVLAEVDVLVVGGGTSGATAAAVAAEQGARTAVLELNSGLGGTGTVGGVDSYWYGRRVGFTAGVDRAYEAVAASLRQPSAAGRQDGDREASRKWNIEAKMHGLLRWTLDAGAEPFFRTTIVGALVEPGRDGGLPAVKGVLAATPDGLRAVLATVTVDASGDADVAAFAGAATVYGSARDRLPLWYSLAQFARPGVTRNNFTSSVDVSNVHDYTRAILAGRRRGECHDHGSYVAPRETRHIVGEVTLTLTDQLTFKRFPDTIAVCFSNSDIKGKSAAEWVLWGLLPPNVESEIPYRAVLPRDLDGVLVCGKAMSCTHDALPAIRMQADLQNLGGACALAAVIAARSGVAPRRVEARQLQAQLARAGALPAGLPDRPPAEAPSDAALRDLVDGLTGEEPFYIDMGFDDRQTEPMTLVRVCTAGERILPLLEAAYRTAHPTGAHPTGGARHLLLARLLAWYGSASGLETLCREIERGLASGVLPARESKIRHAGLPPDQGAMPSLCYLIFTLAMVATAPRSPQRDRILAVLRRVVDCVRPRAEDFRDRTKGVFHYVEAVCHVAERLGDPGAVPLLLALHARDGLHDLRATAPEPDFFLERMAYLEVTLGRALARCGAPAGVRLLAGYLDDARAILAEHAHDELIAVSGADFGKSRRAWLEWLAGQRDELTPRPWTQRID